MHHNYNHVSSVEGGREKSDYRRGKGSAMRGAEAGVVHIQDGEEASVTE